MFGYYFDLAVRGLKRNKALTALMVLAIALGIGATMTTLTVLHLLSGDPVPERSGTLYYPQLDARDNSGIMPGEEPPEQLTLIDGLNLLHARQADRQALMTGGAVPVQPQSAAMDPFYVEARYTTTDFFAMFAAPFRYGNGWNATDDEAKARSVVISSTLNERLFGGANSVGQTLRIAGSMFRVVGVLGDWAPSPHFYDLNTGSYGYAEQVFMPLQTALDLHMDHSGSTDCWGNGTGGVGRIYPSPSCVWMQFWVQLDTPTKAAGYRQFLVHYSEQQKTLGRFAKAPNVRLRGLMEWLAYKQVVPDDVRLQTGLAFGFLLVCLVNTVGLMLAKFLHRSGELSVRRALGATRKQLSQAQLIEFTLVGALSGVLAASGAAPMGWALATYQFKFAWSFSPVVWLVGLAAGAACAIAGGWLGLRNVLRQPPLQTLREA